jgi:uncharacterized protein
MKNIRYKNKTGYSSTDRIGAKESAYLYIADSQIPNSGKGLYTAVSICKDEIISLFKGEILSNNEASKRAKKGNDRYFINMTDGQTMDSMHVKCFAKYANDVEGYVKANFKWNSIITLDENNNVCLIAKREINAGEEIFCSYGKRYWRKYEKK